MDRLFERSDLRRILFIALIGLIVIILFLIFFVFDGPIIENLEALSVAMLGSAIITLTLISVIFFLTPDRFADKYLAIIYPNELTHVFEHALQESRTWNFSGGFGRFFYKKTLPSIFRSSRIQGDFATAVGIITHPGNEKCCELEAKYRNSIENVDEKSDWTTRKVQVAICTSIVAIAKLKYDNPVHNVSLYLSNNFDIKRLDISSDFAIETVEDRKAPAIRISSKHYHYGVMQTEFEQRRLQAFPVDFGQAIPSNTTSDFDYVSSVVERIDVLRKLQLSEIELREIAEDMRNPDNPYD